MANRYYKENDPEEIKRTGRKKCHSCLKYKLVSEFGILRKNEDGLRNVCKECVSAAQARVYQRKILRKQLGVDGVNSCGEQKTQSKNLSTKSAISAISSHNLPSKRLRAIDEAIQDAELPSAKKLYRRLNETFGFDWLNKFIILYQQAEQNDDRSLQRDLLSMIAKYLFSPQQAVSVSHEASEKVNINIDLGNPIVEKAKKQVKKEAKEGKPLENASFNGLFNFEGEA